MNNNINFAFSPSDFILPPLPPPQLKKEVIIRWAYPGRYKKSDYEYDKEGWDGSPGTWRTRDREENSMVWQQAVRYIIENKLEGRIQPFEEVLHFYFTVQLLIIGKHDINWIKGSAYLVENLQYWLGIGRAAYLDHLDDLNTAESVIHFIQDDPTAVILSRPTFLETIDIMADLNVEICDFAITEFHDLMFGEYKDSPRRGKEAYEFDRDFVLLEQRDVAYDVYNDAANDRQDGLQQVHNFFNQEGLWGRILGNLVMVPIFPQYLFKKNGEVYGNVLTTNEKDFYGNTVEEIPDWTMETHREDDAPVAPSQDSEYGKEARIQVPILMLYPESYVDDCQFLKDAPLVKNLDTLTGIEGPQKFGVRAYSPRSKYIEVNEAIEENFKESIVSYLKK